jgi:hypothetical protein
MCYTDIAGVLPLSLRFFNSASGRVVHYICLSLVNENWKSVSISTGSVFDKVIVTVDIVKHNYFVLVMNC